LLRIRKFYCVIWVKTIIERNSSELVGEWTNFINLNSKSKLIIGGLIHLIKGKKVVVNPKPFMTTSDGEKFNFGIYS
jgi:hypothetical protein